MEKKLDETKIAERNETAGTECTQSQVRRISSFLFHVNTILDNKYSQEFSQFHTCHFHMHNPLSTSLINVPVKYNYA